MPIAPAGFEAPLFQGTYFRDLQTQIAGAASDGLSGPMILMAMDAGMDPHDVAFLCRYTKGCGYVIIIRAPRQAAFAYQGRLPGKPGAWFDVKSGADGIVHRNGKQAVSDYDMMSFWERVGGGLQKIVIGAATWDGVATGAKTGAYSGKATRILREMNKILRTRLQHGCQDDFANPNNPGVKDADRFIAFKLGQAIYLPNREACRNFYLMHGLPWLYADTAVGGKFPYIGPIGATAHH
jgi:hypothetical protein